MKDIPSLIDLAGFAQDRAAAEAAEYVAMIQYHEAESARIATSDATSMRQLVERSMIPLQIGQAMGLSEGQVVQRLATIDRILEHAPRVWLAFHGGTIDATRVREVSLAIDKLERDESRAELDDKVVAYARTHTTAELRQWLRRFVVRVEADLATERAEAERTKRHVHIEHVDDGMAWLNAYLPSHQAAAIATRLRRDAKALTQVEDGADDDRTLEQRKADVFVDHLLNAPASDGTVSGMKLDIAVLVDADAVTGRHDSHAEAAAGSWSVPAGWLLESALAGDSFWHRLLVDPATGDTLSHTYAGYATPDTLRRAITFRDGVCASPGCLTPAAECDMDHRTPWPEGPTTGSNLDPRCRRHHGIKGHGFSEGVAEAQQARSHAFERQRFRDLARFTLEPGPALDAA